MWRSTRDISIESLGDQRELVQLLRVYYRKEVAAVSELGTKGGGVKGLGMEDALL